MNVFEVNSIDAVDAHQWDELCLHCPDATVFQSRQWLRAWAEVFATPPADLKLIVAIDGERLVGLAPLVRRPAVGSTDEPWRILGDDYSDYQLFPAWAGSQAVIDALFEGIDRSLPRGDTLVLRDVPQFSQLGLSLAERASRSASGIVASEFMPCPTLRLRNNPVGVARVLNKSSLRRSERSLRRLGSVAIKHLQQPADISPLLEDLFAQHIERWKDTSYPSLFLRPENRRFYVLASDALSRSGQLLYTTVCVDGRTVAQHFGLRSRSSLLWYKPTFDIGLRQHSPGDVLLKSLIEYARDNDLVELDFTRGDEAFKSRFASAVGFNRTYVWYRRRALRLKAQLTAAGKASLRRVLPRSVDEELQLGAAPTSATSNRAIVLDSGQASSVDVASSLARQGVEVHKASQPSAATDPCGFQQWLIELDRKHDFALIVPGAHDSLSALMALPENHPVRCKSLLAPADSLIGCRNVNGEASLQSALNLFCVYVHGRLAMYFASQLFISPRDLTRAPALRLAAIQQGKRTLDDLQWHGPATLRFDYSGGENVVVADVIPYFHGSLLPAIEAGVDLPLGLWRIAKGLRTGPQPGI